MTLQGRSCRFDRKPACDFAHRSQQRKTTSLVGHGFVGNRSATGFEQAFGLSGIRGQMQIGEEDLAFAQLLPLGRLRLLDLHDHVGGREHLRRAIDNRGARLAIDVVVGADARARILLDDDLMAGADIFADRARCQADAIFVRFDFLGDPYSHRLLLMFSDVV
jgi:hypothetical protein